MTGDNNISHHSGHSNEQASSTSHQREETTQQNEVKETERNKHEAKSRNNTYDMHNSTTTQRHHVTRLGVTSRHVSQFVRTDDCSCIVLCRIRVTHVMCCHVM